MELDTYGDIQITSLLDQPQSFSLPPLDVIRGDRVIKLFKFELKVDEETKQPFPLTQFEAIEMDFRKEPHEGSELYVSLGLGDGLSIVGDENNELLIDIPSESSRKLPVKKRPVPINEVMSGANTTTVYEGIAYFDLRFLKDGQVAGTSKSICRIASNVTKLPKA